MGYNKIGRKQKISFPFISLNSEKVHYINPNAIDLSSVKAWTKSWSNISVFTVIQIEYSFLHINPSSLHTKYGVIQEKTMLAQKLMVKPLYFPLLYPLHIRKLGKALHSSNRLTWLDIPTHSIHFWMWELWEDRKWKRQLKAFNLHMRCSIYSRST